MNIPMNIHTNIPMNIPMEIRSNARSDWLYRLYRRTHICPCPEDYNRQLTPNPQEEGTDPVYLALYWTKQEHLYPRFVEEEMDLEALTLMTQEDYAFFGMRSFD